MLVRAMVAVWRLYPRWVVASAAALLAVMFALAIGWGASDNVPEHQVNIRNKAQAPSRSILNRVWFDSLPEKPKDNFEIWIFLAGGVGISERGSFYRARYDIFEFERQGDKLDVNFLHDDKKKKTKFVVEGCDEKPPFTLCLRLTNPLRGEHKTLYGFGVDEDADKYAPQAQASLRAARQRLTPVR